MPNTVMTVRTPWTCVCARVILRERLSVACRSKSSDGKIAWSIVIHDEAYVFLLRAALQEKRIRGAGLDVVYTEPLPKDSPLWDLDNVLLSPHCADRTTTFQAEAIQQFTELAGRYVEGKELFNVVDKPTGY